jgi:tRNA A37 threonylcarbamoyladenosine biosynthesis protein TsaE
MDQNYLTQAPLELFTAADVEPKEVSWLWYPYFPFGKVSLIHGDSGDGKSTFVRTLVRSLKPSKERRFSDIIPSIPQTFLKKPCSHVNTYTYSVGSTFTVFSYEAAFAFLL